MKQKKKNNNYYVVSVDKRTSFTKQQNTQKLE